MRLVACMFFPYHWSGSMINFPLGKLSQGHDRAGADRPRSVGLYIGTICQAPDYVRALACHDLAGEGWKYE